MRALVYGLVLLSLALGLACGRSKHELLEAAEGAKTRAQLEDALGDPDDRHKLGPVETWTYEASDGSVTFLITGDAVALKTTGPRRDGTRPRE